ncbi:hypothetical protein [Paenibacillus sanguinis]|uniref:hypothetical protein n=1 Tax=Paenibacillus sanguinis TaxID=225906 RepID=UPI00036BDED0|nr:hypothetical protein [Paenibacillus sanguinis]
MKKKIQIIFFLLLIILSLTGCIPEETEADYSIYNGYWSVDGLSHEEIVTLGGAELNGSIEEKNVFKGSIFTQQASTQRFARIANITGEITDNKLSYHFTDDGFGNSGTLQFQFSKDSINVEVSDYHMSDKNASGYGISGAYVFIREQQDIDRANKDELRNDFTIISEQSFQVELNEWGKVNFVSGYYGEGRTRDLAFYIEKNGDVLYELPTEEADKGLLDNVQAIGFRDVNKDGRKDVIAICTYYSGAGPEGAIPRAYARIYMAGNKEFVLAKDLSDELYSKLSEDQYTIDHICDYIAEHRLSDGSDPGSNKRNQAYAAAIQNLVQNYIFPDGTEAPFDETYPMEDNKYAIIDIDNDGKDELIINYNSIYTAGMRLDVYEYQSDTARMISELKGSPAASFYDNGMVTIDASHNQGKSNIDDFWPYSLFQFDSEKNQYIFIANVDAWQKSLDETAFPDNIDVDGDGVVYYLMDASYENQLDIFDNAEYEAWRQAFFESADEVQIDYLPLPAGL